MDNGVGPRDEGFEFACLQFSKYGKASEFLQKLAPDFKDQEEENWDSAENDAFMASEILKLYENETKIYRALQQYQGYLFPRFFTGITLDITPASRTLSTDSYLFRVKGILLEHIQGFSLKLLDRNTPCSAWQNIVDQAIQIVHSENDILNTDVRHENFIVKQVDSQKYQVYMIDLAQGRRRRSDEMDLEWAK
jgi:hypothetical protein